MTTFALRHRTRRRPDPGRAWMVAWIGGPVIGIANGVTRELVYSDRVGELTAHQISTGTGIALFAGYFWLLSRRWPLRDASCAIRVGAFWLTLTVLFEFTFGHYVDGKEWSELLRDYDLAGGHLWPLVLAWLAVGPYVLQRRRHDAA